MSNLNFFKGIPATVFLLVFSLAFFWDMPALQAQITNNPQGGGGGIVFSNVYAAF